MDSVGFLETFDKNLKNGSCAIANSDILSPKLYFRLRSPVLSAEPAIAEPLSVKLETSDI